MRLLKPHGSLHWTKIDSQEKTLQLHEAPYGQRAAKRNVIPPTWDKTVLNEWPWKRVWQESSRLLQQARCLIVIGYSVPSTDLMSQALIRSSLGSAGLRLMVVVNPDPDARSRMIDLARPAIRPTTRIIELATLSEFAAALDESPGDRARRRTQRRAMARVQQSLKDVDDRLFQVEDWEWRISDLEDLVSRVETLEHASKE